MAKSHAEAEVERLRAMIAQLRRRQYGPRSERLDPEQYRLELDTLHEQNSFVRRKPLRPLIGTTTKTRTRRIQARVKQRGSVIS